MIQFSEEAIKKYLSIVDSTIALQDDYIPNLMLIMYNMGYSGREVQYMDSTEVLDIRPKYKSLRRMFYPRHIRVPRLFI